MDQEHLKSVLQSLLFVSNKPLTIKDLSKFLDVEAPIIKTSLDELVEQQRERGIVVLDNDGEYQLATNSKNSTQVKNFLNADLREKLTEATVEVLAIIAYRQPISKAEIEAIRGVNSQYSIRHLLMRGMIEKSPNPGDARGYLYQTTTEFLQHMGLTSIHDLPEFETLVSQIKLPETPGLKDDSTQDANENTSDQEVSVVFTGPEDQTPQVNIPENTNNMDTIALSEPSPEPGDMDNEGQSITIVIPSESDAVPEEIPDSPIPKPEDELDDEDEFEDDDEDDDDEA